MHIADPAGAKQANFEHFQFLSMSGWRPHGFLNWVFVGPDAGLEALELDICYRHRMLRSRIGA